MLDRRRGISLLGFVALLPLAAFASFAVVTALDTYRAAGEVRLRDTARALASGVDAELGRHFAALETLATSPLLDTSLDLAAFEENARTIGNRLGGWIVLIGPPPVYEMQANTRRMPGSALPSTLPADGYAALSVPLASVFGEGLSAVSDLFAGTFAERHVFAALASVDRPGQPRRVLALASETGSLRALLAQQDLPPGTFAAIADSRLRILAHSFDPEGHRVGSPVPDWVGAAIDGKQRTLVVGPGLQGQDKVYAVERLRLAPGWTVTVAEPLAGQKASAWEAVRLLLAGGGALGLGLAVVVWANRRETLRVARREAEALRAGRAEVERLHGGLPAVIFLREAAPDGSSRLVYRGGDLETVTGWPGAEFAARQNFEDLIHPEDTTLTQAIPRLLRDGHVSYRWRMRQPGGGWRTLHTLAQVLTRRLDGGAEVVGYTLDVTAEHEAAVRAEATQQDLERTLKHAPVVVFRGRAWPDGSYLRAYISPAIERITGWPMERMTVPGQLNLLFAPEDRAATPAYMRDLVRNGTACCDRRLQRADGRWMTVRMEMSVIHRHGDASVDAVGYIVDITAEREAKARAMASARLASLGEMAAGLAHEIKQPLQSISLAAETAQFAATAGNAAEVHRRLERIVEQTQRTAELVDHLRRFARGAEEGAPPEAFPLAAAIEGALELTRSGLHAASVTVDVALGDPPPVLRGQGVLLEQVLSNLLLNARDALATRPDGAPRRIRIAAAPGPDGMVRLTVADTGGGIAPEVMARLFEPFVTTKGPDKGTGLGLSICHGLVKGMGGNIEARNDDAGAVFTITLPSALPGERGAETIQPPALGPFDHRPQDPRHP